MVSETEYMVFSSMAANQRDMVARYEGQIDELVDALERLDRGYDKLEAENKKLREEIRVLKGGKSLSDSLTDLMLKQKDEAIAERDETAAALRKAYGGLVEKHNALVERHNALAETKNKLAADFKECRRMQLLYVTLAAVETARAKGFARQAEMLAAENPDSPLLRVEDGAKSPLQEAFDRLYAEVIRGFGGTDEDILRLNAAEEEYDYPLIGSDPAPAEPAPTFNPRDD